MARRLVKCGGLAIVVAVAVAWWRSRRRIEPIGGPTSVIPSPTPAGLTAVPSPEPAPAPEPPPSWVEPVDGTCPAGYPIKVNERSGIFHLPGGLSYERTKATRCYGTAEAAEADGFRRAKR